IDALEEAAKEVGEGKYFEHFIVPAMQGGAGTSINMNINEIVANAALLKCGYQPGEYTRIDPLDQANIYQSTNDVVPTALHLSLMRLSGHLETAINGMRETMERLEQTYRNELRQGYTQMQKAVPSSYGHLFGSYANAFSRDWWRVSRIRERLKEVNLGGGAAGTGLAIPRYFVLNAVRELRQLTNLPLAHGENLADATMNQDTLVETHAIIKAFAVNLEKICSDLRLLASDISVNKPVSLPKRQMGSSFMPGKVNPVIIEYVISIAHKVYANDHLITNLAGQGCLDLNPYTPTTGTAMIESFTLLLAACTSLSVNMLENLSVDASEEQKALFRSPAITTALVPYIGHHKAGLLALEMEKTGHSVFEANKKLAIMPEQQLSEILTPSSLTAKGFSLKDLPGQENHLD
ncbi:MAG: lyase family protein, partial [Marinilabilia sp.]